MVPAANTGTSWMQSCQAGGVTFDSLLPCTTEERRVGAAGGSLTADSGVSATDVTRIEPSENVSISRGPGSSRGGNRANVGNLKSARLKITCGCVE